MRKNWWWFRLIGLSFATVALGFYLFHSTPWRRALGLEPDYKQKIAEGDRVVAAIDAFRARTGLWPEYLDDVPAGRLEFRWFYELQRPTPGQRTPALSTDAPAEGTRAHLGFIFDPQAGQPGWHVFTGSTDRLERAGPPAGAALSGGGAATRNVDAALAELDGRISREPTFIEHRQDKISLLVLAGRDQEARAAIEAAIGDLPEAAWPRLARAQLAWSQQTNQSPAAPATDRHLETLPAPTQAFVDWAQAHPSLTRFYDVCWHLRELRDTTRAAAVAAEAIAQPLEVDADDTHLAAFYLYDMARFAYQRGDWPLTIAICNAWQKADEAGKVKDQSYFALRAAAKCAQGDLAAGKPDLAQAEQAESAWIGAHSEALRGFAQQVDSQEKQPHLQLPAYPGAYELFVEPE